MPTRVPGAWCSWWGQGWQHGGVWERCLPSAGGTHTPPSCQVKIFEEDFQRERSDRERMNEEKEELKQQLEKLQKQLVLSNNQVSSTGALRVAPQEPRDPPGCVRGVLVPSVTAPVPTSEQGQKGQWWFCCCLSLPEHLLSLVSAFCPSPGDLLGGGHWCRHSRRALQHPSPHGHGGW